MVILCDGVALKWCNSENMQWFNDAFGVRWNDVVVQWFNT